MQYRSCHGNTGEAPNENKMADSRFTLSNQNVVEKLEENARSMLKATQTWLNVWVTERKVNPKSEEFEREQLRRGIGDE